MSGSVPIIIINHYSGVKPIECELVSGDLEKFYTLKVKVRPNYFIGKNDPIVTICATNPGDIVIQGGIVASINTVEDMINLIILHDSKHFCTEKRKNERFPVSLQGYVKGTGGKNTAVLIKDISSTGIRIFASDEYKVGDAIGLDVNFVDTVKYLDCFVIRMAERFNQFEYGLSISHTDRSSIDSIDKCIATIRKNQIKMMEDLIYAKENLHNGLTGIQPLNNPYRNINFNTKGLG